MGLLDTVSDRLLLETSYKAVDLTLSSGKPVQMFNDLYAYRERQARSPLEDFSTEALKAVLNAAPTAIMKDFIIWIAERCHADIYAKFELKNWEWRSQISLSSVADLSGFIDLALFVDGKPLMVFENKVGAGFQPEQLERYGEWLAKIEKCEAINPCLAIITQNTSAPEEFLQDHERYHISSKAVFSWAEWLRHLQLLEPEDSEPVFCFLLAKLEEFFEEHDMSTEYPSNRDFAALHNYLPQEKKLRLLVDAMFAKAREKLSKLFSKANAYLLYDSDQGLLRKYAYCGGRAGGSLKDYLAVGLRFPDIAESDWGLGQKHPHIFINIADDNCEIDTKRLNLDLQIWTVDEEEVFAEKALHVFSTDADQRGEEILSWIQERAEELAVAIDNSKKPS